MITVPRKYGDSAEYGLVRDTLIRFASKGDLFDYSRVAEMMSLPPRGHHMAREVGQMLGEISEAEHLAGRPMLSAIVVSKSAKTPGKGFFILARQLGKLLEETPEEQRAFWEKERDAVFAEWGGVRP